MARLVFSASGRLINNTSCYSRCLLRFLTPPFMITSTNMAPIKRFQGQSLHVGVASYWQAPRKFWVTSSAHPGTPSPPPSGNNSSLGKWILGITITGIVPFLTNKWTKLLHIKDEVETVVEETEQVIERVEDVAEVVDKVAKDVADHLPKDGKLRNVVESVEDAAEEIIKDAHLAENIINKVEKIEDKVDTMVEQVNKNKSKNNI